jgi:DNA-binding GntR family transcriptional regulator
MTQRDATTEDSTVENVLSHIREGIISGFYPPGSKLLPKFIAEQCGSSFIPVREAMRVLETKDFVTFLHNRGVWVTPISMPDLEDLYMMRIELECKAVRQASKFMPAEIEYLEKLITEAHSCNEKGDNARVIEINRDFHFAIYEKSKSPRRIKLIEQLWEHSARYQRLSLNSRHEGADNEHRTILKFLKQGDHRGAANALKHHLQTTVDLIGEQIKSAPEISR